MEGAERAEDEEGDGGGGGGGGGGSGGGEDTGEEGEEEEDGSRGCVGPRAWVVAVASLPFLAIGISLSCIGYLAPEGKGSDVGGLGRHFRIAGPIFLSACGAVLLLCCACRRPGVGRVGTDSVAPGRGPPGAEGVESGEWWREGKGGGQPPPRDDVALWGSCTLGDCQCPPTPGKEAPGGGVYPQMARMVPPLLKVIPPTPESPAARKEESAGRRPSPRHLLLLTPLRLKQRT